MESSKATGVILIGAGRATAELYTRKAETCKMLEEYKLLHKSPYLGVESRRNDLRGEHASAHRCLDRKVLRGGFLCSNDDTISLRRSDIQLTHLALVHVDSIYLDDSESVLIELEVYWCEGSNVDDSEEIAVSCDHRELNVLCFVDKKSIRDRFRTVVVKCIGVRLIVIDQWRSFIVVEITNRHQVFCTNTVWRIDVLDDKWTTESINVLSTNVSMIPISAWLVNDEFIDKCSTRLNWALGHHGRSIGIGCIGLMNTVEMDCRRLVSKAVRYSDDDGITHVGIDRRVGPLSINTDKGSSISIGSSSYPSNTPNVVSP
jgi:hypothetical protein